MKEKDEKKDETEEKKIRNMFAQDGRPYNINENKSVLIGFFFSYLSYVSLEMIKTTLDSAFNWCLLF